MDRYDSKLVKANHKMRCTADTLDEERCPNIVYNPIDGLMLCHIHHPKMPFQIQQAENRKLNQICDQILEQHK